MGKLSGEGEGETSRVDGPPREYIDALRKIESETEHNGCYRCGACIAHKALYGHEYKRWGECCWEVHR